MTVQAQLSWIDGTERSSPDTNFSFSFLFSPFLSFLTPLGCLHKLKELNLDSSQSLSVFLVFFLPQTSANILLSSSACQPLPTTTNQVPNLSATSFSALGLSAHSVSRPYRQSTPEKRVWNVNTCWSTVGQIQLHASNIMTSANYLPSVFTYQFSAFINPFPLSGKSGIHRRFENIFIFHS